MGDVAEVKAIRKVFTDTSHLKMNATKSLIGHCLGAAAGIEAVAVVKAIETGWLHPTLNQHNLVDEVAGIDTVPNEKKQLQARAVVCACACACGGGAGPVGRPRLPPGGAGAPAWGKGRRSQPRGCAALDAIAGRRRPRRPRPRTPPSPHTHTHHTHAQQVEAAISNSFGFGGHNSAVIFGPYKA